MNEIWETQTIDDWISATCDAGNCEEATIAVILTEDHGWLPMCRLHTLLELESGS